MPVSRKAWLLGGLGVTATGVTLLSLPGGGLRTFFGGISPPNHFAPLGTTFSPQQLRAELTWLVDTMREVGANPFAYCPEATFNRRYAKTLATLDRPLDARGFFLKAAPLFAELDDGHVSLSLGYAFEHWENGGGNMFPLLLAFHNDEMYVDTPTDETLTKGTLVESIDGVAAAEIVQDVLALQGAQTPLLRLALAPSLMSQFYYARYGEPAAFEVVARLPGGRRIAQRVKALPYDELYQKLGESASDPYVFSRIADGRVGYIEYRQCRDLRRFKAFLRTTFTSIAKNPVDGVVIDIRENGGGESVLNAELWRYLTSKSFSDGSPTTMKVSSRLKREYGFFRYNLQYLPPAWFMRDGSLLTEDYTWIATIRPGANPLRYKGPVYLLIGTKTFSSALDCAQEAKDYRLATLVGQETGEPLDTTGTAYDGYTPRIGTRFQFTTRYSWFPNHPKGRGVIPDVTIIPTEADIRSGKDPVLDYAVAQIKGAS
jgi:Peptidase family S41